MDKYHIHLASPVEFKKAVEVRIHLFVDVQGFPLDDEVDEDDKVAIHVVAVDKTKGNKVIGTLRMLNKGETAKIGRVAVLPDYQGQGIGIKLMEFAKQHAARDPAFSLCKKLSLSSQYDKRKFYENRGYEAQGNVFDILGCPHIMMHMDVQRVAHP
ncbi:putative acetyl transferase [Coemansia reversa NRRL 1564]|uniref:Putative acetyl transferase n=1 Tax=Coemansia reversa (strain ATCC 12441 / NRRL 1564) TaxID=763665 RepID=A0A2G5BHP9_COERN|nr:putative acetyl transferase [Coemansia reversa NRRL 1564]|eukprot:PIA18548.1 putative acetyl transferase [Coemansia reversa NRRL 1564]